MAWEQLITTNCTVLAFLWCDTKLIIETGGGGGQVSVNSKLKHCIQPPVGFFNSSQEDTGTTKKTTSWVRQSISRPCCPKKA